MSVLIQRLTTELGWPKLTDLGSFEAYIGADGTHCVFVPGDPARNLESNDVAVILPELHMAFQGQFDLAVADAAIETQIREATGIFKTPSVIFFRAGAMIGAIPKVRDWDDYMTRVTRILQTRHAA